MHIVSVHVLQVSVDEAIKFQTPVLVENCMDTWREVTMVKLLNIDF